MKQITILLIFILLLAGCQNEKKDKQDATYDAIVSKTLQDFKLASEQIKKDNPDGLLKLWEIATESTSAEYSEIAAEEVRGYLYSKTELWIRAFSKVDFPKFKKEFESIDFDIYRFTPDGELPVTVVAKRVVEKLKKMKGKNHQQQVLIDYLITYYGNYLKNDKQSL